MISFVQLPYRRSGELHKPRELGPAVVAITLSLILLGQLALVLWLYFNQGRY
jgi:hypothetical protein